MNKCTKSYSEEHSFEPTEDGNLICVHCGFIREVGIY